MKKTIIVTLACACSLLLHAQQPLHTRTDLAEHTDRVYIGQSFLVRSSHPRFSWVVPSSGNGTMQTAYQIQVATCVEKLLVNADVWDSQKCAGNQSVSVPYQGADLQPSSYYYWRVKTWDNHGVESGWSEPKLFLTADTLDGEMAYYPLTKTTEGPVATYEGNDFTMFDFGHDAFAQPSFRLLTEPREGDTLTVHLGERSKEGRVDRSPGGSIRYSCYHVPLHQGQLDYTITIRPDKRNTALGRNESRVNPILMPVHIGEVTPFRYCEVEGGQQPLIAERQMVHEPFDDDCSSFISSDSVLNKVWDLCKYSMKATSFCGVYVDGDRERLPYEADAYVNQLSHYAVDAEYTMARHTASHVTMNPTWPTEWILLTPVIAWNDYLYTGDDRLLRRHFNDFQAKTLFALEDSTGFISTKTKLLTPEIYQSVHFKGKRVRDIIDWPQSGAAGLEKENGGEADGYESAVYNSVVNAYYYHALCAVRDMAGVLGNDSIRAAFAQRADRLLARYNETFFDKENGRYVDAIGRQHASQHASMFPLAFGMVESQNVPAVADYIKSRGMACSVYGAQFLLDALYNAGEAEAALRLLTSTARRSWYNMLRIGSTITTEAWDDVFKPNQDWNHAWGAAAANIITRRLMGVEPLEPSFGRMRIKPQPGSLREASVRVPTIRGIVAVSYREGVLDVEVPANTEAEVWLPWSGKCEIVRGGSYRFTK